ncbi:MAG: dTDP-4-dehydrorhamnose 3,5-epimerase [Firmicutes bacterium HGW-Firmicutes-14]|nr:MAG: dTDP-4-dehydrorhamnose 3,5-epimerase [Firmicutes bacterium HGW-Firmicutes-14]
MQLKLIEGVKIKKLRVIPDERGRLMEMLRCDDDLFIKFGQAYMTSAYPGVVKGWHYHMKQTDNFVVVRGMMKVVLYDSREDSPTKGEVNEFFMGTHNPILLQIPPYVFHGFKCIGEEEALVVNFPTEPYNYEEPDEYRVHPHDNDIPYDWTRKDG